MLFGSFGDIWLWELLYEVFIVINGVGLELVWLIELVWLLVDEVNVNYL